MDFFFSQMAFLLLFMSFLTYSFLLLTLKIYFSKSLTSSKLLSKIKCVISVGFSEDLSDMKFLTWTSHFLREKLREVWFYWEYGISGKTPKVLAFVDVKKLMLCFICFWLFVFWSCLAQLGCTPGSVFWDCYCCRLGDHMQWWGMSPAWPCARQTLYLLYYLSILLGWPF